MPKPQQRQPDDLSRSLICLNMDMTLIVVIEMSQSSWLVAGIVPGVERQPLKKMKPDEASLLALLYRWRDEASRAGHTVSRIAVAFEAGRDGFWLARWLRAHAIDAYVIHASSVAVSREHRRAKTDRLDTELLKRAFLGWLRGEVVTARWWLFRPLTLKMPNVPIVSGKTWLVRKIASSTG
jgi:transposase